MGVKPSVLITGASTGIGAVHPDQGQVQPSLADQPTRNDRPTDPRNNRTGIARHHHRTCSMKKSVLAAALTLPLLSAGAAHAAPDTDKPPLDAQTLSTIGSRFSTLMELANRHDLQTLSTMFWQSPSVLLVAKSAVPSQGNWAGFWGNAAVNQKLHDIATSGPVVLTPDLTRLKVVGLSPDVAESYAPVTITVSYAGQDGTPKPFLMILNWVRVSDEWKIAAEIILPVPPAPAVKG
jgi:hypothetical protein